MQLIDGQLVFSATDLVGFSPEILRVRCRTPRQMQLANAVCRFLEMADSLV